MFHWVATDDTRQIINGKEIRIPSSVVRSFRNLLRMNQSIIDELMTQHFYFSVLPLLYLLLKFIKRRLFVFLDRCTGTGCWSCTCKIDVYNGKRTNVKQYNPPRNNNPPLEIGLRGYYLMYNEGRPGRLKI